MSVLRAIRDRKPAFISSLKQKLHYQPPLSEMDLKAGLAGCSTNEGARGSSLVACGLRVWHCHCSGSGCCFGIGSIPGLGVTKERKEGRKGGREEGTRAHRTQIIPYGG